METRTIIQTIGGIAKQESLFTLTSHVMANTFVLENEEPYPGYHGENLPTEPVPISIFMITREKYSPEHIFRINQSIRKYFEHYFDAVPGVICIQNEDLHCIRLRGLENYELVEELQNCFFSEGVKFMKKRTVRARGVIQLKKLFNIEEVDPGIYKDLDDPSMFYITLPNQVNWQKFVQLTQRVRNNIAKELVNFDAALGAIYAKEILDVARIYTKDITIEKLQIIKEWYHKETAKLE
ncbi:MAG TPA: hypothetical protein VE870_02840 [Bacteroidales bacterium]|nr:hypothetical protein [Bacteroidales bacterium]